MGAVPPGPRASASRVAVATAVLIASAIAGLAAAPASTAAPLCLVDHGVLTVTNQGHGVTIARAGWAVTVNGSTCVSRTFVDRVVVNMAHAHGALTFRLDGGLLAPGGTDEGDGSSEIEFTVRNLARASAVVVIGSSGADAVTVGDRRSADGRIRQLNLNANVDGRHPDADVTILGGPPAGFDLRAGAGDDRLSGAGIGTNGSLPTRRPTRLDGGEGGDRIRGGEGRDTIWFSDDHDDGTDSYRGGAGRDIARVYAGGATARASLTLDGVANDGYRCPGPACEGDDLAPDIEEVVGSQADEIIAGGPGRQVLWGGPGHDTLIGGRGDDLLGGQAGNDSLFGGDGEDSLFDDQGSNALSGGRGADTMWAGPGSDLIHGGPGTDSVSYFDASGPVHVSLNGIADDGGAGERDDLFPDVEDVVGTSFDDTLVGDGDANILWGLEGDNILRGRGGDDQLIGRHGDDTADGGPGTDTCFLGAGANTEISCER